MIEKIARRAGGFASTTALRWIGAGREALPEAVTGSNGHAKRSHRLLAGAAAGAVAVMTSNKSVRAGIEQGLLTVTRALRPQPSADGKGNGVDTLGAKTRAELYEMAKKVDLPGRSSMSKDELAKALGH